MYVMYTGAHTHIKPYIFAYENMHAYACIYTYTYLYAHIILNVPSSARIAKESNASTKDCLRLADGAREFDPIGSLLRLALVLQL